MNLPHGAPPQIKFLSDKELAERYAVSRNTIWRWARDGNFPKPISLNESTTRWKLSDIKAWEQDRESAA